MEVYSRYHSEIAPAAQNECVMLSQTYVDACFSATKIAKGRPEVFCGNEKFLAANEALKPLTFAQRSRSWAKRQKMLTELASQAISLVSDSFSSPADFSNVKTNIVMQQLVGAQTRPTTFVMPKEQVLLHQWVSRRQARRFHNCLKHLSQILFEANIGEPFSVPLAFLVSHVGCLFTVMHLVPLTSDDFLFVPSLSVTQQILDSVKAATYTSSSQNLPLFTGADGRYYLLYVDTFHHSIQGAPTDRNNCVRLENVFLHRMRHATTAVSILDPPLSQLEECATALANGFPAFASMPLHEVLAAKFSSRIIHSHGLSLQNLGRLIDCKGLTTDKVELNLSLRNILIHEMVWRTLRRLVEAAMHLTPLPATEATPEEVKAMMFLQSANDVVQQFVRRKGFFTKELLPLLQDKFKTSSELVIDVTTLARGAIVQTCLQNLSLHYDRNDGSVDDFTEATLESSSYFMMPLLLRANFTANSIASGDKEKTNATLLQLQDEATTVGETVYAQSLCVRRFLLICALRNDGDRARMALIPTLNAVTKWKKNPMTAPAHDWLLGSIVCLLPATDGLTPHLYTHLQMIDSCHSEIDRALIIAQIELILNSPQVLSMRSFDPATHYSLVQSRATSVANMILATVNSSQFLAVRAIEWFFQDFLSLLKTDDLSSVLHLALKIIWKAPANLRLKYSVPAYRFLERGLKNYMSTMVANKTDENGTVDLEMWRYYTPEDLSDLEAARPRLVRMYYYYAREKMDSIDSILEKYVGREEKMFAALTKKYGPEPVAMGINLVAPTEDLADGGAAPERELSEKESECAPSERSVRVPVSDRDSMYTTSSNKPRTTPYIVLPNVLAPMLSTCTEEFCSFKKRVSEDSVILIYFRIVACLLEIGSPIVVYPLPNVVEQWSQYVEVESKNQELDAVINIIRAMCGRMLLQSFHENNWKIGIEARALSLWHEKTRRPVPKELLEAIRVLTIAEKAATKVQRLLRFSDLLKLQRHESAARSEIDRQRQKKEKELIDLHEDARVHFRKIFALHDETFALERQLRDDLAALQECDLHSLFSDILDFLDSNLEPKGRIRIAHAWEIRLSQLVNFVDQQLALKKEHFAGFVNFLSSAESWFADIRANVVVAPAIFGEQDGREVLWACYLDEVIEMLKIFEQISRALVTGNQAKEIELFRWQELQSQLAAGESHSRRLLFEIAASEWQVLQFHCDCCFAEVAERDFRSVVEVEETKEMRSISTIFFSVGINHLSKAESKERDRLYRQCSTERSFKFLHHHWKCFHTFEVHLLTRNNFLDAFQISIQEALERKHVEDEYGVQRKRMLLFALELHKRICLMRDEFVNHRRLKENFLVGADDISSVSVYPSTTRDMHSKILWLNRVIRFDALSSLLIKEQSSRQELVEVWRLSNSEIFSMEEVDRTLAVRRMERRLLKSKSQDVLLPFLANFKVSGVNLADIQQEAADATLARRTFPSDLHLIENDGNVVSIAHPAMRANPATVMLEGLRRELAELSPAHAAFPNPLDRPHSSFQANYSGLIVSQGRKLDVLPQINEGVLRKRRIGTAPNQRQPATKGSNEVPPAAPVKLPPLPIAQAAGRAVLSAVSDEGPSALEHDVVCFPQARIDSSSLLRTSNPLKQRENEAAISKPSQPTTVIASLAKVIYHTCAMSSETRVLQERLEAHHDFPAPPLSSSNRPQSSGLPLGKSPFPGISYRRDGSTASKIAGFAALRLAQAQREHYYLASRTVQSFCRWQLSYLYIQFHTARKIQRWFRYIKYLQNRRHQVVACANLLSFVKGDTRRYYFSQWKGYKAYLRVRGDLAEVAKRIVWNTFSKTHDACTLHRRNTSALFARYVRQWISFSHPQGLSKRLLHSTCQHHRARSFSKWAKYAAHSRQKPSHVNAYCFYSSRVARRFMLTNWILWIHFVRAKFNERAKTLRIRTELMKVVSCEVQRRRWNKIKARARLLVGYHKWMLVLTNKR